MDGYHAEVTEKGSSRTHAPRAMHENGRGYRTSLQRNTVIVKLHAPPVLTASSAEILNQKYVFFITVVRCLPNPFNSYSCTGVGAKIAAGR